MTSARVLIALLCGLLLAHAAIAAAPPRELAQTRALLAIEYLKLGNMRVALENAEQAIAADAAYQAGHLAKALIYMQLGVDREADAAFGDALRLAPANPEVNNNYGAFLCRVGRSEQALQAFDRALADPFFDAAHSALLNKALCLERLGRQGEVTPLLLAALQRAPGDAATLRELTRLALNQNNATLAEFYYRRLGKDEKKFMAAELWLGVRLARLQQNTGAEQRLAGQLKTRFPDSVETQQLLSGN